MVQGNTIEAYYKRKRSEQVDENPSTNPPPLLELEQQNQNEVPVANEQVVFRGTEFLERDPAKRPQIWRYPPSQRDVVQRAYLNFGPMQPLLQVYKPSGPVGHQRRFQFSWFSQFPSCLEYSESNHRAYCLFCFVSNKNNQSGSDVFTVHGFESWKKVKNGKHCAFLTHIGSEPCSRHNNAVTECQALLNQPGHIDNVVAVKTKKEIERNRLRLRTSIAAVKWLTMQSCAFRGHDETPESRNRGNFLEMLMLLAEFNPEIAQVILGNAPYNSKYTCPDIQKEILGIFASKVRKQIRDEIGDSKFAILVDETCDVSKREQMAIILRFVDSEGILQERFFDLIHVTNTKAATLKQEICFVLSTHSLDVQNLRGQGYDGASNMKGELNGLQALFLRECPYAYYVHCYAHRLQLALVGAAKDIVPVTQFFQKLNFIVNTVDSSAKRHDELHEAQLVEMAHKLAIDDLETGTGQNQICALKRPGDTRWGSHFGSISSLMHMYNAVRSVLINLGADSSAGTNRADGDTSFNYLSSFEFVFVMCMMKEIMEITDDLGRALQKKKQDIINAVRLVHSTKVLLGQLRSDDGWEEFFLRVVEFCVNHGVAIPDMQETYIMRGGRARRQPDHFTKELYFRVEIFRATIDTQLNEINLRFNEKVTDLLTTSALLIPRNGFRSFNAATICDMVKKYYPADFSQQDIYGLEQQLNHFVVDANSNEELKHVGTLADLCRCLVETRRAAIYNLIDRLLRLLVTLPVSTATAERAFSTLKTVKTRLRNKMEDEFLANSLLVQIEGELADKWTYDDIIGDFKKQKSRRVDL